MIFKGPKTLERGVYYLVSQDKAPYFDFFVSDANQTMVMSTDNDDLVKSLKSISHKENDDFFSYIKFITAKNKEFGEIRTQTKGMSVKDSTAFINEKSKKVFETVDNIDKRFGSGTMMLGSSVSAHKRRGMHPKRHFKILYMGEVV